MVLNHGSLGAAIDTNNGLADQLYLLITQRCTKNYLNQNDDDLVTILTIACDK